LQNCLAIAYELHKIDPTDESLFKIILNNSILTENAFSNSRMTQFLIDTWNLLKSEPKFSSFYQIYIDTFLKANADADHNNSKKLQLTKMLNFNKNSFKKLIDVAGSSEIDSDMFEVLVNVLTRHQTFVFENEDLNLLEKLNALTIKHAESIKLLGKCLRLVLGFLANNDYTFKENDLKDNVLSFLVRSFKYRCSLFREVVQEVSTKNKLPKNLKKLASENEYLSTKFKACLSENEEDIYKSDTEAKPNQNKDEYTKLIESSEIHKLVDNYTYTLSQRDVSILKRLSELDKKLDCLIFKAKADGAANNSDALNRQTKLADFIGSKLDETYLEASIHNFPLSRKLDNMGELYETKEAGLNSKIYDPIYLLPNMYNLLDYGRIEYFLILINLYTIKKICFYKANIVDVLQFVQAKFLSYLFAATSSECPKLRSLAYASIYRFMSHLESKNDSFVLS
jgi:hypothetical protein